MFLMRDIIVRYPSSAKETLRRNSKLKNKPKSLSYKENRYIFKSIKNVVLWYKYLIEMRGEW
jgi:hypothetical protein